MDLKIKDVLPNDYDYLIKFYSKYGGMPYRWYSKKLKKGIISRQIIGKICIKSNTNEIVGAYLGRVQPLLSNYELKSIQSIDTLISPDYRGGKILIKLAREFYEHLKLNSFDCIYGLPNHKIEKFRYRFLKWNYFNTTYVYYVLVPVFILKILYKIFNVFIGNKYNYNFTVNKIEKIIKLIHINEECLKYHVRGVYWISHDSSLFTNIGLCRYGKTPNIFDKLFLLTLMSSKSKSFFLKTYSTSNTETAKIFKPFSFKKKALNFSGLLFNYDSDFKNSKKYFEFIEFDNFGLD